MSRNILLQYVAVYIISFYQQIEVKVNRKIYGRGRGHTKQAAAKEAAREAIEALDITLLN